VFVRMLLFLIQQKSE